MASAAPATAGLGFWTGATIAARLEESKDSPTPIIAGYDPERVGSASYRLRVGEEIYVSPSSEMKPQTKQLLKDREGAQIPPGQFAFLTTEEHLRVPKNCLCFITLRSKATKFRGLVNVSGFHVDPGYDGKLVFAVFNAGPGQIHVARGDEWFEIFFASLDGEAVVEKKDGFKGLSSELITPLAGEFLTFSGLSTKIDDAKKEMDERIQKVEREHTVVRWSVAILLGALVTFGVRSCGWKGDSSPDGSVTRSTLQHQRAYNAN